MTKLTKFDGAACRVLRETIAEALSSIDFENRHGVDVAVGSMSYSKTNINVKLEVSLLDASGKAQTQERIDFVNRADWFKGLEATDLDREFKDYNGTSYKIVGLKPKSRKYPILVENIDNGVIFKFPAERVVDALARVNK